MYICTKLDIFAPPPFLKTDIFPPSTVKISPFPVFPPHPPYMWVFFFFINHHIFFHRQPKLHIIYTPAFGTSKNTDPSNVKLYSENNVMPSFFGVLLKKVGWTALLWLQLYTLSHFSLSFDPADGRWFVSHFPTSANFLNLLSHSKSPEI